MTFAPVRAVRSLQRVVVDVGSGQVARWQAARVLAFDAGHPLTQPDRTSCGSSTLTVRERTPDVRRVVANARTGHLPAFLSRRPG